MSSSPTYQPGTGNQPLTTLGDENSVYNGGVQGQRAQDALQGFQNGTLTGNQALNQFDTQMQGDAGAGWIPAAEQGFANDLATGATTGSQYAAQQIAGNQPQNSLYGSNGQLGNTENLINQEQSQGFNLTPGDNSLYGQEAGQIADQFGQQGNQAAQALASRGLSNSGAAGATFSGIAGNQNQMLANAQQEIAQQRFQNTQQQIARNQNYAAQLGSQYNTALNNQYERQLQGAQNQTGTLLENAGQTTANNSANNSAQYQAQSTGGPGLAGIAEGIGTGLVSSAAGSFGKGAGQAGSTSLFGAGAAPTK